MPYMFNIPRLPGSAGLAVWQLQDQTPTALRQCYAISFYPAHLPGTIFVRGLDVKSLMGDPCVYATVTVPIRF